MCSGVEAKYNSERTPVLDSIPRESVFHVNSHGFEHMAVYLLFLCRRYRHVTVRLKDCSSGYSVTSRVRIVEAKRDAHCMFLRKEVIRTRMRKVC